MAIDLNDALDKYLSKQDRNVIVYHTISFKHHSFNSDYYFVMNSELDLDINGVTYRYAPISIGRLSEDSPLQTGFSFAVGGANNDMLSELKLVQVYDSTPISVNVSFWRSDDLSVPLETYDVEAVKVGMENGDDGQVFVGEAGSPIINNNRTGLRYSLTQFPMLRGFL